MQDMAFTLTVAASCITALLIVAAATLRAWNGWLALKRAELARPVPDASPFASARIEIADLKERIRKLEAIAAGVDL